MGGIERFWARVAKARVGGDGGRDGAHVHNVLLSDEANGSLDLSGKIG